MKRHALLIGAPRPDDPSLAGRQPAEEVDVERMTKMLCERGFQISDIEALRGPQATRHGILAGYRRLIERVEPGDIAVVYFAGHGGMVELETGGGARSLPKRFQFIAPTDYDETTVDDFRGISAWELSQLLAELTARTTNVAVILDCCHAAQMSRGQADASATPRAIAKLTRLGIGKNYDEVRARFVPTDGNGVIGNPNAVRLVACGEWQSAYPMLGADGRLTGTFTDSLLATLDEIGNAAVSWRTVGDAVRTRVLRMVSTQRPIVEGPVTRRPFSLDEIGAATIPIVALDDGLRIDAGRIAGISVGDVYGVTSLGADGFTDAAAIATVRVERVEALHAIALPFAWFGGHASIPANAVVWPLELALGRHPVRVDAPSAECAVLEAAVAGSARLRVATAGDLAIGGLRLRGGELLVTAGDGRPLDRVSGSWGVSEAVRQLETLAAAQTLRELEGEHGIADEEVEVEWGTVHGGVRIPRPLHGAALALGDRIYLRLRNRTGHKRFAHVFNIGLRGRISLLSAVAPAGILLVPGEEELVGIADHPAGSPDGFELGWPQNTPREEPGVDTLMIIVTTQAADLRALETEDVAGARGKGWRGKGSPLQRLVSQLHEGGMRSAAGTDPFFVVRRSYVLHPLQVAIAGRGFAIDEDPLAMHAALRPEVWVGGATWRARPVEIRLRELAVERPIRIDALVCTRSADPMGGYQARTCRFAAEGPHDGELLWRGPVRDLLDIYLWVAPDRAGDHGLDELLATARALPEVAEARRALVISDDAAPWSLAGGASAALARIAGELLRDAATGTAGLLHTSFVAHEHYGIGRQPAGGLYRADGVAFALSITDLEVGDPAR